MRYPIGNQDFRSLRRDGYVYVDKTRQIARVLREGGKYLFLARPRRFGKSLTVSTLRELHSGDRELFVGLWAYDNWDFAGRQRPVIHVRFAESDFQTSGLEWALNKIIDDQAAELGLDVPEPAAGFAYRFRSLIAAAAASHPSGRCVVLVDEYDKPIIEYLRDLPRALANRDLLRPFYGVLKDADSNLDLVFLTGVSAFSKLSLFSELNNLLPLTLHPVAETLVGITEAELSEVFGERLGELDTSRDLVRQWYNGYSWGAERVYNPWSLLLFLSTGQIRNYWSTSGTPRFLVDYMAREGTYDVDGARALETELLGFDLERLNPLAVCFQGGYLTIDSEELTSFGPEYTLRYPNQEVRATFLQTLLEAYGFGHRDASPVKARDLLTALRNRDLETLAGLIDALLAGVPAPLWRESTERFYHAIVHTAFTALGLAVGSEVYVRRGRLDTVVEVAPYGYVIEFKLLRPTAMQLADDDVRAAAAEALAGEALAQITERGYVEGLAAGLEPVVLAVVFDAERRAVAVLREG